MPYEFIERRLRELLIALDLEKLPTSFGGRLSRGERSINALCARESTGDACGCYTVDAATCEQRDADYVAREICVLKAPVEMSPRVIYECLRLIFAQDGAAFYAGLSKVRYHYAAARLNMLLPIAHKRHILRTMLPMPIFEEMVPHMVIFEAATRVERHGSYWVDAVVYALNAGAT
jgi:hypothetical protein